jgi:hypothetical protein
LPFFPSQFERERERERKRERERERERENILITLNCYMQFFGSQMNEKETKNNRHKNERTDSLTPV